MNKIEIVQLLIKISRGIYSCYQELVELELVNNKEHRSKNIIEIYRTIREYRLLEDEYFSKLVDIAVTNEDIDEIYDHLFELYGITDGVSFFPMYVQNLDQNIEARRVLERIKAEIVIPPEIYLSDEDDEDDFKGTFDEGEDLLSLVSEETILVPLLNEEDIVRLLSKIDTELLLNCDTNLNSLPKRKIYQIKYDLFFLNRQFEGMLVNDYCIPSLSLVDAKDRACSIFNFRDEKIEKTYDTLRENDILLLVEDLSQKKNKGSSFENKLRYILIDLWIESISDSKLFEIMGKIEDRMNNSYNEEIEENRANIYHRLYSKYGERIMEYEIEDVLEEEDMEEDINSLRTSKSKMKFLQFFKGRKS